MNILLHICCAPCAIAPLEELKKESHKVAGFFYNPNIHPYSEYLKRKAEVERYAAQVGLAVMYSDYDIDHYLQHIVYNEPEAKRCPICWWLRLEKTSLSAKKGGFDAFTTTLLGSPYQDHQVVKSIAEEIAEKAEVRFYYKDFRPGFKKAHDTARSKGMYCQNYCGCLFSEKERIEKSKKRNNQLPNTK